MQERQQTTPAVRNEKRRVMKTNPLGPMILVAVLINVEMLNLELDARFYLMDHLIHSSLSHIWMFFKKLALDHPEEFLIYDLSHFYWLNVK